MGASDARHSRADGLHPYRRRNRAHRTHRPVGPRTRFAASPTLAGAIPAELKRQIADPVLWMAVQMNGFIGLGVVFLMTTKPGLVGSLITLIVALVLGVVSAWLWRPGEATTQMKEAQLSER